MKQKPLLKDTNILYKGLFCPTYQKNKVFSLSCRKKLGEPQTPHTLVNIIQIWTYDESNIEFYGYKATILTEAKLKSILLPKIRGTHIARHHRSIYALLYMSNVMIQVHRSIDIILLGSP